MKVWLVGFCGVLLVSSCTVSKSYSPAKKIAPEALKEDYAIFQSVLEDSHPGLYWYTSEDSMNYYFEAGKKRLQDSLTEGQFRMVLSYVVSKIRCGHTSVRSSKAAAKIAGNRSSSFPLYVKAWPDTVLVTANLNRNDSNIVRGVVLRSINGIAIQNIIDSLFQLLPSDGFNTTHKYQSLSNGSTFRNLYAAAFGLKKKIPVEYFDTSGNLQQANLSLYTPLKKDSTEVSKPTDEPSKRERRQMLRQSMRSIEYDSSLNAAVMEVNTFAKGYRLRKFFRQSFKDLKKKGIENLVIDLRGNGGGSVTLSNLLTKYLADKPFKIADSLYAIKRSSKYGSYQNSRFFNWLFLQLFTKKKKDGGYHFWFYEGKHFQPKNKNHFNGSTYIITGGNTFSAASLVAKSLSKQDNVVIVGEETGGGAYGNNAWLIPDVTLPNSGVRFRLPLFRLVIDRTEEKGFGVKPDVPALPSVDAIRSYRDYKMEKVKALIKSKQSTDQ